MEINFFKRKKQLHTPMSTYIKGSQSKNPLMNILFKNKYPLDRITNSPKISCIIMLTNYKAMYKSGWK